MSSFWMPKKQPLYAPMLSTFGGGSARGFGHGIGGGADGPLEFTSISFSSVSSGSNSGSTRGGLLGHTFSQDGNWVYMPDYINNTFYWAQCSAPFTFPSSGSNYTSATTLAGHSFEDPSGVWVSRDGSYLAVQERGTGKEVVTFSLSTPFDPSSATRIATTAVDTLQGSRSAPNGCHFSEDGSKFAWFTQGTNNSWVDIFNCSTPFIPSGSAVSTEQLDASIVGSANSLNMLGASIDPSGKWLFVTNHNEGHGNGTSSNTPHIYYAKMSTAYDLTTRGSFSKFNYASYVLNDNSESSVNTAVAYPEEGKISVGGYSSGHVQVLDNIVFS